MLNGEATNTSLIIFGFTRPGHIPTIYCTRSEHTDHYTTDALINSWLPLERMGSRVETGNLVFCMQLQSAYYYVFQWNFNTRITQVEQDLIGLSKHPSSPHDSTGVHVVHFVSYSCTWQRFILLCFTLMFYELSTHFILDINYQ